MSINLIGSICLLLIIIRQAIDKNHLRNFEELVIIEEIPTLVIISNEDEDILP